MYLNIDDGYVPLKDGGRGKSTCFTSISAYTSRYYNTITERWELFGKRNLVLVANKINDKLVINWLKENYILDKNTLLLCASDAASKLKSLIKKLPNAVWIAARFQTKRNEEDRFYLENNKVGIDNYDHYESWGCSAESDISSVKNKLANGQRIFSLSL